MMPSPLPAFDCDPLQPDELTQEENTGIFPRFFLRKGRNSRGGIPRMENNVLGEKGEGMIAKRAVGFTAAAMVLFLLGGPLAAADRTILLDIPGCSA
jgi:hypothetical protein